MMFSHSGLTLKYKGVSLQRDVAGAPLSVPFLALMLGTRSLFESIVRPPRGTSGVGSVQITRSSYLGDVHRIWYFDADGNPQDFFLPCKVMKTGKEYMDCECGLCLNRDHNAAINLLNYQSHQGKGTLKTARASRRRATPATSVDGSNTIGENI